MANNIAINIVARSNAQPVFKNTASAAQSMGRVVQSSAGQAKTALNSITGAARPLGTTIQTSARTGANSLRTVVTASQSAADALDNTADKARGLHGAWGSLARVAGAGIATVGINQFTGSLIRANQEAAAAQKKLQGMLNVRGQGDALGMLQDSANELSRLSGMDDDLFADAQAHLLSFGLTANQIKDILPGALSQSITMGQDLISVVDSIGRSMSSLNAGALRRSGVVISQEDIDAIKELKEAGDFAGAQAKLFDALRKSFSNYSVSIKDGIDENARAMGYFTKTIGDTQEIMGKGAADFRASWQAALTPTLEDLNKNHEGLIKILGASSEIGTQALNLLTPLSAVAEAYLQWRNAANLAKIASGQAAAVASGGNIATGVTAAGGAAIGGTGAVAGGAAAGGLAGMAARGGARGLFARGLMGAGRVALGAGRLVAGTAGLVVGAGIGLGVAGYEGLRATGALGKDAPGAGEAAGNAWGRLRDAVTGNSGYYDRQVQLQAEQERAARELGQRTKARNAGRMVSRTAGFFQDEDESEVITDPSAILERVQSRMSGNFESFAPTTAGGDFTGRIRSLQDQIAATKDKSEKARLNAQMRQLKRQQEDSKRTERQAKIVQKQSDEDKQHLDRIRLQEIEDAAALESARLREANEQTIERERANLETALEQIDKAKDAGRLTRSKAEEDSRRLRDMFDARRKALEDALELQTAQLEARAIRERAAIEAAAQTGVEKSSTLRLGELAANRVLGLAKIKAGAAANSVSASSGGTSAKWGKRAGVAYGTGQAPNEERVTRLLDMARRASDPAMQSYYLGSAGRIMDSVAPGGAATGGRTLSVGANNRVRNQQEVLPSGDVRLTFVIDPVVIKQPSLTGRF